MRSLKTNLFGEKTKRKTELPTVKESQILHGIIYYLTYLRNQGRLYFIRNNSFSGFVNQPNGRASFIRNNNPGSSDLIIFLDRGQTLFVEVKSATGKTTEIQDKFADCVNNLGYCYFVVRSCEDIQKILERYL